MCFLFILATEWNDTIIHGCARKSHQCCEGAFIPQCWSSLCCKCKKLHLIIPYRSLIQSFHYYLSLYKLFLIFFFSTCSSRPNYAYFIYNIVVFLCTFHLFHNILYLIPLFFAIFQHFIIFLFNFLFLIPEYNFMINIALVTTSLILRILPPFFGVAIDCINFFFSISGCFSYSSYSSSFSQNVIFQ